MKPKLFIVTSNAVKFKELSTGLGEFFDCEQKVFDEPEIQGRPDEIIKHKIKQAYKKFHQPVLVDDTSVHLEELNGFPGPYMKDFWECFTPFETGVKFAGSRIKVVCRLGLCRSTDDLILVEGVINGEIIKPKSTDHKGRQFDLFVKADGTDRVLLEFSHEEKNKFSHRGLAMKNLLEILKKENK